MANLVFGFNLIFESYCYGKGSLICDHVLVSYLVCDKYLTETTQERKGLLIASFSGSFHTLSERVWRSRDKAACVLLPSHHSHLYSTESPAHGVVLLTFRVCLPQSVLSAMPTSTLHGFLGDSVQRA